MASYRRSIVIGVVAGIAALILFGGFIVFAAGGPLILASLVGVGAYSLARRFM